LQERTEAYGRAGIDVFWWLGGRAATTENLTWCVTAVGLAYTLRFEIEQA